MRTLNPIDDWNDHLRDQEMAERNKTYECSLCETRFNDGEGGRRFKETRTTFCGVCASNNEHIAHVRDFCEQNKITMEDAETLIEEIEYLDY